MMHFKKIPYVLLFLLCLFCVAFPIHCQAKTARTTDTVRMRTKPDTSSDIIITLDKGTKVTVQDYDGNWAHVTFDGKEGYIFTDYLSGSKAKSNSSSSASDSSGSSSQGTAKVNADDVNFRKKAGGKVIGQLDKGEKVTLLSQGEEWTKVETSDGTVGYIYTSYLGDMISRSDQIEKWKEDVIEYCKKHLKEPYSQKKRDLEGYYDCSSLVRDAYESATGQYIGDTTLDQNETMEGYLYKIKSIYDASSGDIVYHMSEKEEYHCGIYIGDGTVINASKKAGCVTTKEYDEDSTYWELGCKAASYCYDQKNAKEK